ncbi:NAD(P)H-dependent glycerol-3-phosphate dehydrogenase [Benzoatithermus flavus]|uniref:Glycerol-3-phosphate dehydrogenase [NAD(P)+] n=1 Tax=Benzoatithermus flavus TaxID=3108223 RepID=A0ABU8XW66_9PROT
MTRLGVVGAGAWGTALAIVAARAGNTVRLWGRDPDRIATMAAARENRHYLPGVRLPVEIAPTARLDELADAEALLLVVPAQQLRAVCRRLPPGGAPLVICAKGLEQATGLRLSQVVAEERPGARIACLSGPSFAAEVGRGLPTAVTIAAEDKALAGHLAERLASLTFRPYPSDDLLGVELAGALKNVIAIAAGVTMGKGLGENARAALVTRGLAEMGRLAHALGARRETLMGLSGLGDLLLTATSLTSRNTSFGFALAQGRLPAELLAAGEKLSEGAYTAEAACRLAARVGVELPIAAAVRAVVAGELDVDAAIEALLSRPLAPME